MPAFICDDQFSVVMQRFFITLLVAIAGAGPALAQSAPNFGGGFVEFIFSGGQTRYGRPANQAQPARPYVQGYQQDGQPLYGQPRCDAGFAAAATACCRSALSDAGRRLRRRCGAWHRRYQHA